MGSWSPQGKVAHSSLRRLGTSLGTSTAAGFITPRDPRFVKGQSGSPDTGTGEDEFPFSAVRLLTPLILRVQMMNFFLLFIFPSSVPSHSGADRAEQMVLCREAGAPRRIQILPTPRPRAPRSLDFLWERQQQCFQYSHWVGGWMDGEELRRRGCPAVRAQALVLLKPLAST